MNKVTKIVLWVLLGLLIIAAIVVPSVIFSLSSKSAPIPKPKKSVSFSKQSGGLCRTKDNQFPSSTLVETDVNNCEKMCSKDKNCVGFDTEMGEQNPNCSLYYSDGSGKESASTGWVKGSPLMLSDTCKYFGEYSYCPKPTSPTKTITDTSSKIYNTKNYVCYIKRT